jgi:signal peptidase II
VRDQPATGAPASRVHADPADASPEATEPTGPEQPTGAAEPAEPARSGGPDAGPGRPAGQRRRVLLLCATAGGVLTLDIISKLLVVVHLAGREPVDLIPGVLDLQLTRNAGAAFSVAGGATVLFTLVAVAVVVVIARTARQLRSTGWVLVFGLVLGGALGNLVDRLFRSPGPLRGHVVDWIHLHHWPVFNLADSAIVVGAVLAVLMSLRGVGIDGSRHQGRA